MYKGLREDDDAWSVYVLRGGKRNSAWKTVTSTVAKRRG